MDKLLKKLIKEFVEEALEETSAISAGGASLQPGGQISGTGGNPLGRDMSDQYEIMWSGDKPEDEKRKNLKETKEEILILYHGTCKESAKNLIKNGWHPQSGYVGGNLGQTKYLYLTTEPENARWFANEKGCNTILKVGVPKEHLIVDPEDGLGSDIEDELKRTQKIGLPANFALTKPLSSNAFQVYNNNLNEEYLDEEDLDEFSAVGGGAVVGYTLPLGMKPDYKTMGTKGKKKKRKKRWYDVKREAKENSLKEAYNMLKIDDLDEKTKDEIFEYLDAIGLSVEDVDIEFDVIPAANKEDVKFWLKDKIKHEGPLQIDKIEEFCSTGINRPIVVDLDTEYTVEGRHRLAASYSCDLDVPIVMLSRKKDLEEEYIGTKGGVRYYQMGGSLPDALYNKTDGGKPTRDPGVAGIYKNKKK